MATKGTGTQRQTYFRFFNLPIELRSIIYKMSLSDRELKVRYKQEKSVAIWGICATTSIVPRLTLVSKQFRKEYIEFAVPLMHLCISISQDEPLIRFRNIYRYIAIPENIMSRVCSAFIAIGAPKHAAQNVPRLHRNGKSYNDPATINRILSFMPSLRHFEVAMLFFITANPDRYVGVTPTESDSDRFMNIQFTGPRELRSSTHSIFAVISTHMIKHLRTSGAWGAMINGDSQSKTWIARSATVETGPGTYQGLRLGDRRAVSIGRSRTEQTRVKGSQTWG